MRFIISQRGQGGSAKGRPTNLRVPYKGPLSNSDRAIAQRTRAATRSEEEDALHQAKAGDRSAKYQAKKRLEKDEKYCSATSAKQTVLLSEAEEALAEARFRDMKSGKLSQHFITYIYLQEIAEWLEDKFLAAHKKWDAIELEVDLRDHQAALQKIGEAPQKDIAVTPKERASRAGVRLFGPGGAMQKILHDEYQRGLKKLNTNTFESAAAKEEWTRFRDELSPETLSMVSANEFM